MQLTEEEFLKAVNHFVNVYGFQSTDQFAGKGITIRDNVGVVILKSGNKHGWRYLAFEEAAYWVRKNLRDND